VNDDDYSLFMTLKFGYCYVYAWNKTLESIFQNSNCTRPVK